MNRIVLITFCLLSGVICSENNSGLTPNNNQKNERFCYYKEMEFVQGAFIELEGKMLKCTRQEKHSKRLSWQPVNSKRFSG